MWKKITDMLNQTCFPFVQAKKINLLQVCFLYKSKLEVVTPTMMWKLGQVYNFNAYHLKDKVSSSLNFNGIETNGVDDKKLLRIKNWKYETKVNENKIDKRNSWSMKCSYCERKVAGYFDTLSTSHIL